MRILVTVKNVPDTDEIKIDEQTGTMVREGIPGIINPLDLYAVEVALRLREQHGGEILAVSMGPPSADTALREALSMGVDRAILLTDRKFAGADTWATARTLAAATERLGPFDVVLCGERATDGETGQVGPELADMLDIPLMTYVSEICEVFPPMQDKGGWLRARRLTEEGYQKVQAPLPVLLTVVKEIGEPRLPTFVRKLKARTEEVECLRQSDLDLPDEECGLSGSPTRVVRVYYPTLARETEKVEGSADKAVERIIAFLQEKGLV